MKLDNAKANLANESLTAMCEFVGCVSMRGRKCSPDERPYIERFFGTIASGSLLGYPATPALIHVICVVHSLIRRAICASTSSLTNSGELVEYAISSYHGTPHTGLNNATPLEAIEYFVRGRQRCSTWLLNIVDARSV